MKVETGEHGEIILKEVYNPICFISDDGERIYLAMRDSGFEITYCNVRYDFKEGEFKRV